MDSRKIKAVEQLAFEQLKKLNEDEVSEHDLIRVLKMINQKRD